MNRYRKLLLVALLALVGSDADEIDAKFEAALRTIVEDDVKAAMEFLTSDACAGRDTPQPGMFEACRYVANRFKECGLEPVDDQGTYLLDYGLGVFDAADSCSLIVVSANGGDLDLALRSDFVPAAASADGVVEGEIVFAGYGIKERKYRWDSYKRVDVKGKIAVVLALEPRVHSNDKKFFDGIEMTDVSSIRAKAAAAAEEGAIGLLVCAADDEQSKVWMSSQVPYYAGGGRSGGGGRFDIPVAVIPASIAEALLGTAPSELQEKIDKTKKPVGFLVEDKRVRLEVHLEEKSIPVPNVIARYPGQDPSLLGEVVVVGAHVDHVGVDDRGRVHRGADDNAGGVCGLLEVAEAFGREKPATRRSVIFIAFTGEEKGLLGSRAYVREPPIAIAQTYGMFNMDIIARGRPSAIEATPPPKGSFIDRLLKKAVKLSNCRLKVGDGGKEYFQRSDHYAFHEAGVPTIFFNEGSTTEDYHKWTDTPDKVDHEKVARVARLVFTLTYLSANSDLKGGLH